MKAKQLRDSILQLAIQGKLVPQDPNDEPASVLLEKIREEKQRLIKEGKIKKEKNESYIYRDSDNLHYEKVGNEVRCIEDEIPFDIPDSWEWCRLINICNKDIKRGKSPKYVGYSDVLVFAQKCNTKYDGIKINLCKYLDKKIFPKYPETEYMKYGDIIINSTGNGTLGRVGLLRREDNPNNIILVPDSHVTIVRLSKYLYSEYIYIMVSKYNKYFEEHGEGSTNQKELKPSIIQNILIPIPPIEEQFKIMDKINSLHPLLEKYDSKELELTKLNSEIKEKIKQSILQHAIQGKLVEQDPNDEPASILLEKIREEKQKLVKEGKIKKDKNESFIFRRDNSYYEKLIDKQYCIDDEIPFSVPTGWTWARFGMLMINRDSERIPLSLSERKILKKTYDYYGASGVIDKVDKYLFDKPLLLIGEDGANLLNRNTPIAFIASGKYWVNNHAHVLDTPEGVSMQYIATYINAISLVQYVTGTAQPKMNQKKMNSILVPVPPTCEQLRIVKKINTINELVL